MLTNLIQANQTIVLYAAHKNLKGYKCMINYQKELDKLTADIENSQIRPRLLLHSCCAPCSSYVLDYLYKWFDITVYYYNPNIYPYDEYIKRKNEQLRLIKEFNLEGKKFDFIDADYNCDTFIKLSEGLESEPEGQNRCHKCYELRLKRTAECAKEYNYDFFATTLTVSPYKNAQIINNIGAKIEAQFGVKYLYSDFKKKNGYLRSIELSKQYNLYRQNYCGCMFSMHNS